MWLLQLNDMRSPRIEIMTPVARAESRAVLMALLTREDTAPYRDGQWSKRFRQGGPLEWFNPPSFGEMDECLFEMVSLDTFLERQRAAYQAHLDSFPLVL